jgi:hypothetical protein
MNKFVGFLCFSSEMELVGNKWLRLGLNDGLNLDG